MEDRVRLNKHPHEHVERARARERERERERDRTIDVCDAIDGTAIERVAIGHGDRDRDNGLTSFMPIT